jgi:uncharacterized membrane protein AbrB (regulator of aidB expression)
MIAGGASGIVGMSGELGADDRLVAFMQYLRVLVVVLLTPIGIRRAVRRLRRRRRRGAAAFRGPARLGLGVGRGGGAGAGRRASGGRRGSTAGVLLGPMILTGVLVLAGRSTTSPCPTCSARPRSR